MPRCLFSALMLVFAILTPTVWATPCEQVVATALTVQFAGLELPAQFTPINKDNPLTYELFLRLEHQAKALALSAHAKDAYDQRPYQVHLHLVLEMIRNVGGWDPRHSVEGRELILAAWLHDTVEDTKVSVDLLRWMFGESLALLVDAVTKIDRASGLDDSQREKQSILKVRNHRLGPALKAADRLANVVYGFSTGSLKSKYRDSYPMFEKKLRFLATSPEERKMWQVLDQVLIQEKLPRRLRIRLD
jgi:hypothetical protein